MNTKYLALKHNVTKLNKRIVNAQEHARTLQTELEESCPHNFTKEVPHNTSGGYLNRATYRTDIYCSFCGKLLQKGETTTGSFE